MKIPNIIYGTAWKEERTEGLVFEALKAGFTAIDTANQRKHYYEEAVGRGFQKFLSTSGKKREDFFLQTKFTYVRGQDHRLPYDSSASFTDQVQQSFESSLKHLGVQEIDSYVLHGPYSYHDIELSPEDFEVWKAMESLYTAGKVKALGVSNVTAGQLQTLCEKVKIKPKFAQIRTYASNEWELATREVCKHHDIHFQGFSLLTANVREISQPFIKELCLKYNKTIPQIIFRYSIQIGIIPITGTTDPTHMKQDLNIFDFELSPDEVGLIEG